MKYLVNRETKEHKVATPLAESIIKGYADFKDDWQLVEADSEGWITWSGGECPLPDGTTYESLCYRKNDVRCVNEAPRGCWEYIEALRDGCIKAYRPFSPNKETANANIR